VPTPRSPTATGGLGALLAEVVEAHAAELADLLAEMVLGDWGADAIQRRWVLGERALVR